MRVVLKGIALINVAVALWLCVMFVVLKHDDYQVRALLAAGVAAFCALGAWWARPGTPGGLRAATAIGSVVLAVFGGWLIRQDLTTGDFEGFVLIVGTLWILQGIAAVVVAPRG